MSIDLFAPPRVPTSGSAQSSYAVVLCRGCRTTITSWDLGPIARPYSHPKVPKRLMPSRQAGIRSEEHTSELQSLMRISCAVFCVKKKQKHKDHNFKNGQNTSS